jgi:L-lysine exporter family protein LysE/ArgO
VNSFGTGFLLSLSLCLDIGIANVAILRTALGRNGTAGFLIGLGSCVGDLIYFVLAILGSAALLEWAPIRWTLWLFGTGALLYMTSRMAREVVHPKKFDVEEGQLATRATPSQNFFIGLGLALASPTAILWFAAIGGSVIASVSGSRYSVWGVAAGFAAAGVTWSALLAYGAARFGRLLGPQLVRSLAFVSALLFLYFAIFVFVHGLQEMLAGPSIV